MRVASGRVVGGRVEVDGELPEGESVTVLALDGDETFEADEETERMLLEAIDQCDRRQTTRMSDLAQRFIMTLTARIEIDPDVMLGKPVIRGTRIPIELILRKLSDGASDADLLDAYPRLTREDIQAAMRYAADALAHEEVVFIGKGTRRNEG